MASTRAAAASRNVIASGWPLTVKRVAAIDEMLAGCGGQRPGLGKRHIASGPETHFPPSPGHPIHEQPGFRAAIGNVQIQAATVRVTTGNLQGFDLARAEFVDVKGHVLSPPLSPPGYADCSGSPWTGKHRNSVFCGDF